MNDIGVLITVHSETALAGPTFASADAAILAAEQAGFTVERRIGFDNPSETVLEHFTQPAFAAWEKTVYSFKDQGATRDALAQASNARFLAFLDADDLWSENWLLEAARVLDKAEKSGQRVIAHPEANWIFEGSNGCLLKIDQDDPYFLPEYFCFANYYDALCMAPRAAHLDVPYAPRDIKAGYALEDWQWNIETMQAGWCHRHVPDTLIFKRRQAMSQTIQASRSAAVIRNHSPLQIDKIGDLAKAHTSPPKSGH